MTAYYRCFNQPHRKEASPLMCVSLWSKSDLLKEYTDSELILAKSATNQTQKMEVDIIYAEHLEDIEYRQARNITRYIMALTLTKNDQHVITATQTLIETIKQK